MIFSKAAISLLCVLLLLSVFVANLLNIIATDHNFYAENRSEGENFTKYLAEKYGKITDTTENLIWFLQVSSNIASLYGIQFSIDQVSYLYLTNSHDNFIETMVAILF